MYLEKMNNRKHRSGYMIKIIKPDGQEIIIETMKKLDDEYSFSAHLIRKYRDKDMIISENDIKDNKFLLNCRLESIN